MSLELEIRKLTEVMIELNATMQALRSPQVETAPNEEPTRQPETETSKAPTDEDLKQLCLSLVRKNPALKPKIKAILESFGASKAPDVKAEDMPDVIGQIKALET
jgi:hypothetical protein